MSHPEEPHAGGGAAHRSRELASLARPPRPVVAERIADTGWGHTDDPDVRVLVFRSRWVVVVVEVRRHRSGLVAEGFVRPTPAAPVTVRPRRRGHIAAAAVDSDGRFTLPLVPPGPFSVAIDVGGADPARLATEWVSL